MLPTIMSRGPIDLWTRTPRSIAPFSASAPSHHNQSSAHFITNIAESDFWYTQGAGPSNLLTADGSPHATKAGTRKLSLRAYLLTDRGEFDMLRCRPWLAGTACAPIN